MSVIQSSRVSAIQLRVSNVLESMEKWSGLSELSVILWVSAVKGCLLSAVPLNAKQVLSIKPRMIFCDSH